jgi:murein DD-endopeptidase MepM/ murein hydrolase activator NlpD
MSDRFFTLMLIPEKSSRIRKVSIPAPILKLATIVGLGFTVLSVFVIFDYVHLLSQVAENKKLKVENHILRTDVETAKGKLETLEQSVGRLKSFAHKLRVISNLDQPGANRLLEAPTTTDGGGSTEGGGVPTMHEDGGSIEGAGPDDQSQYLPEEEVRASYAISSEGEDTSIGTLNAADPHSRLEYQRSLTLLDESSKIKTDDILGAVEKIMTASEHLTQMADLEEQNFAGLQEHLQDRVARLRSTPSILPTRGWISSEFGYRINPFSNRKTFHAGIDIANYLGTPVVAPADGVVSFAGQRGGFGNVVQLDHGYNIVTRFGHNSRIVVKVGDRIKRGQKISEIGSSGRSTGPHLHYEVALKGRVVNPRLFILEDTF